MKSEGSHAFPESAQLGLQSAELTEPSLIGVAVGCRFRLELNAEGCDEVVAEGELTDGETAILEMYLEQYDAIATSPSLSSGLACDMQVKWDQTSMSVEMDPPDEDTLGLLLHRLRPFVLANEPASFLTVASIVGKNVKTPPIRELLRWLRREFDGRAFQEAMKISINDIVVNSERTLMDWLNSHEYHRDTDKRESISRLLVAFPEDFARGVFINMLIEKFRACVELAGLVAVILGRQRQLSFGSNKEAFSRP